MNNTQFYKYLKSYVTKNGFAPSYREIAKHFKWVSPTSAMNWLHKLEAEGFIKLMRGVKGYSKSRAIKLLK